jgi:phosphoribosyl-ATP pyrophosphohydrolase
MSQPLQPICDLMRTLQQRAQTRPSRSYTTKLLDGGVEKIGGKIREEAEELIEAASEEGDAGRAHFVYEAGDLIYHTLVLLAWRGVDIDEVAAELARREGTSGLAEKASRKNESSDIETENE